MSVLSKVLDAVNWAFVPDQNAIKHIGTAHPVFSFLMATLITLIPTYMVSEYLEKKFPKLKGKLPNWSRGKLAGVLIAYVVLMLISRYKFLGNLLELKQGDL